MYPRLKHLIFRYYLLLALLLFIGAFVWFVQSAKGKDETALFLTLAGSVATGSYFVQKQKLEELLLFKQLFTEFNARYDKMNEAVNAILTNPENSLTLSEKNTLNDYFNLCGEEFLFFKKGYIYPEVWRAWHNGMQDFFNKDDRIREYWDEEKKSDSYYGLEK
jgi:hypothetical protein